MTKIYLTFWREEHKADERRPGVVNVMFKPFSDRIANHALIEAKNGAELATEINRHLDQLKTHLATLAVEEYGADAYVKPSVSADKRIPNNRKFANFDQVARQVCNQLSFNAFGHLDNVKATAEKAAT